MRTHATRGRITWALTALVFLLFAFPNYCDRCTYRDVARLLASGAAEAPPCCCAKPSGPSGEAPKKEPKGGGSHVRYTFCIAKSLSSLAGECGVLPELRRAPRPAPFRAAESTFPSLDPVSDHKDGRAPPA